MRIYVLGDSISIHYGSYLEKYLKNVVEYSRKEGEEEALLNLDNPQGANGGDSSMVLKFLQEKSKSGGINADFLLLNCGLHDIKVYDDDNIKQVDPGLYESNLKAIVKIVSTMGLKLIWIRITPVSDTVHNSGNAGFKRFSVDVDAYNEIADAVMKDAGISSIDLNTFTGNLGDMLDLYEDHIHFKEHVREKQAAFIAGCLWFRC